MQFIKGERYRHKLCLDTDILVVHCFYSTPNEVSLNVLYVNRNYLGGNMIIDSRPDRVTFKPDSFWQQIKKEPTHVV